MMLCALALGVIMALGFQGGSTDLAWGSALAALVGLLGCAQQRRCSRPCACLVLGLAGACCRHRCLASPCLLQVLICLFVAGFAASWGLIVWVLGTEVQSLETRSAGMSVSGRHVGAS